jgi:CRP/FNR family cyclic AMP-dependent transcriptional regulator
MKINKNDFEHHIKFFEPGKIIFQEGDRGEELYIIIEGEIEIRKTTYSKSTKTLITLHKGDIFGEMSLIDKKARSATAVATQPTKLLIMNETLFEVVIEKNPDFAKKMIKILSERIRRSNSILQNLIVTNKESQVLSGVFQYAHDYGIPTFNGFRFNLDKFSEWAQEHLGILDKDLSSVVKDLFKRGTISHSALGKNEVIIKQIKA